MLPEPTSPIAGTVSHRVGAEPADHVDGFQARRATTERVYKPVVLSGIDRVKG
jgi:hypothetical protein